MPKVVVRAFACSLDGFGAGLQQSESEPFGKDAIQIMNWFFPTRTFKSMRGEDGGTTGLDDGYATRAFEGVGASIMGRNMFGPLRGPGLLAGPAPRRAAPGQCTGLRGGRRAAPGRAGRGGGLPGGGLRGLRSGRSLPDRQETLEAAGRSDHTRHSAAKRGKHMTV